MQRRRLLQLGLGGAAVLALAGAGVALVRPGLTGGRLSAGGRAVFRAVGAAVLDGALPTDASARLRSLDGLLARLEGTIAGLAPHAQDELSTLLALLASAPGRVGLAGLTTDWSDASVAQVHAALQAMRTSALAVRQQAYFALRELTNAAYFADPTTWAWLGYPGPNDV
ncbi:hypothetical protein [Ideonella sp. BN130291]|uniref:hypothetical protein n=1 Tax=Ideonella sp. BN130291 TaxID=3112940 RepID=UPI002E26D9DA|nr:hypothetical protein [Ideonella sp. BN130291]